VSLNPIWLMGPEEEDLVVTGSLSGIKREGDTSGGVVLGLELVVVLTWFERMKGCSRDVMAISSGRTIVVGFRLSIVVVGTSGGIRD